MTTLSDVTTWTLKNTYSAAGGTVVLNNGSSSYVANAYSEVISDWRSLNVLRVPIYLSGSADAYDIGFIDAGDSTAISGSSIQFNGRSSVWAARINIWNDYIGTIAGGSVVSRIGSYYQMPWNEVVWVYFVDQGGGNMNIGLARADGFTYLGSWTVAAPSFTACRVAIGVWSGSYSLVANLSNPVQIGNPFPTPAATRRWNPRRAFRNVQTRARATR